LTRSWFFEQNVVQKDYSALSNVMDNLNEEIRSVGQGLQEKSTSNPQAKWQSASEWLSQYGDTDQWALVLINNEISSDLLCDRQAGVPVGFILECVWRSDWVAFDEVSGRSRLLTGFQEIPEPLPQTGSPRNYARGAWIFEAQLRSERVKPLRVHGQSTHLEEVEPFVRVDSHTLVKDCKPQQLMEALMLSQGKWNCCDPTQILTDLYANSHLWINYMMLPYVSVAEGSDRLHSNLGYLLRDIGSYWHADTLYVWSRDDDCVYPLVDFGNAWSADDVQVMDRDRASRFIGYGGAKDPPPVVIYWWD
jgi:hypothetical protein